MGANLFKQLFTGLRTIGLEGDERQVQGANKVISYGMFGFISTMIIYSIIVETLNIRFDVQIPFSMSEQIIFLIGIICFICSIYICKNGLVAGVTSFTILFCGIVFPAFLLSEIPILMFGNHQEIISLISLLLIPIMILASYLLFNYIYKINYFNEE